MSKSSLLGVLLISLGLSANALARTVTITRGVLLDKIRGGWVGKAYGVSFGGPTEFRYQGEINEGSLQLDPRALKSLPGQDDMYVNMALLKAGGLLQDTQGEDGEGEDAPAGFEMATEGLLGVGK
jgi:hypothetical protein